MKKILFIILVSTYVTLVLASCEKEKEEITLGTLKAYIGSQPSTFNISARATRLTVSGGYGIQVKGYKKDPSASGTFLSFLIVSPNPITAGEYTENQNGNPLVEMEHFTDVFFGVGGSSTNYGNPTNPVNISITEINSAFVKGMFRGDLRMHDISGHPTGTGNITHGEFYLAF